MGPTAAMDGEVPQPTLKRLTRTRKAFALLTSLFLFLSVIFLILVEIGSTYNRKGLTSIYFFRLDLTHIVPSSVQNYVLINSFAQTIGLHDFYQVGLWGFCEGYNGQGVTHCSKPKVLYWFNPVQILLSELLAGSSINLPMDITNILDLVKTVSQWMFGLFLTGACLSTIMIFLAPLSLFSKWNAVPIGALTFFAALCTTVATVIATVMSIIFKQQATSRPEVNIGASIGTEMFAFMWIATAFSVLAAFIQIGLCCCCTSRRDVKRGNTKHKHENEGSSGVVDAPGVPRKKRFGFRK